MGQPVGDAKQIIAYPLTCPFALAFREMRIVAMSVGHCKVDVHVSVRKT